MKLPILHILLAAASALPVVAGPVTLTWGAQERGSALCQTNGIPLDSTSVVRLGYFDISPEQIQQLFAEPVELDTHFTTLASSTITAFGGVDHSGLPLLSTPGTFHPEAGGCFAASLILSPLANSSLSDGQRCYIWVMNNASVADATEHGVISDHTWVLNLGGFGPLSWDLSEATSGDPSDLVLGHRGPQSSPLVGGKILRLINTAQLKVDRSDDDRDGVSNLLENAFVMDPGLPDSAKLPRISLQGPHAKLNYIRKSGGVSASDGSYTAGGLRYTVEVTCDLNTWITYTTNNPAYLLVTPATDPNTENVSITLSANAASGACLFARVRVERVE